MERASGDGSGVGYAVAGATGNVGSEVVKALVAAGHRARALVRTPDRAVAGATETVVADLNDPESLGSALEGVDGVFLLPGYAAMDESLARAKAAGVGRVVLLSSPAAANGAGGNAVASYMAASETAVQRSGIPWTIVRSCMFATNALEWVAQLRAGDTVRAPFPDVRAAVIHPADIGATVAAVATGEEHAGQTYRISGPEATTPAERLAVLGDVLGRRLTFTGLTDDEARAELEASMPQPYADAFLDFYVAGSLDESPVLPTVERLTGRSPRPFRDWAREHGDRFR